MFHEEFNWWFFSPCFLPPAGRGSLIYSCPRDGPMLLMLREVGLLFTGLGAVLCATPDTLMYLFTLKILSFEVCLPSLQSEPFS